MFGLLNDLQRAGVILRRSPGFSITVIFALALGVGANSAVFSAVNATLLRPLPYASPEQLNWVRGSVSLHLYSRWKAGLNGVADIASYRPTRGDLLVRGVIYRGLWGCFASTDLFRVLGIRPLVGTGLPEEGRTDNGVLLSFKIWHDVYDSDPDIVGKPVIIDSNPYTVVGVMPKGFGFPQSAATETAFWLPISLGAQGASDENAVLNVLVRLPAQTPRTQLRARMEAIAGQGLAARENRIDLLPLGRGVKEDLRLGLLLAWGASALLLLLTCGAVAGLHLVRAARKQGDIAIRLALGAGRIAIVKELLLENLLLAGVGSVGGLCLAAVLNRLALPLLPTGILPDQTISLDTRIVILSVATAVIANFIFGFVPALKCSKLDCLAVLHQSASRSASAFLGSARSALILFQTAVTLVLLIGTGLFLRTMAHIWAVPLGFRPDHILAFNLELPKGKYTSPEDGNAALERIRLHLGTLPGIEEVGGTWALPFWGYSTMPMRVDPRIPKPVTISATMVTPHYFSTMRIPLLRGRGFTDADGKVDRSVVIDARMAARYWPNENPVGKHVFLKDDKRPLEIVGIVDAIHQRGFMQQPTPTVYFPSNQFPSSGTIFVIRTLGDPSKSAKPVLDTVQNIEPGAVVFDLSTLEQVLSKAVAPQETAFVVLGAFSVIALIVAVLGVYGFVAYAVKQRTREIGIRLALGAHSLQTVVLIVQQTVWPVIGGLLVGLVGAMICVGFVKSLLFGIAPSDPLTFAASALCLLVAAVMAGAVAAWHATSISPLVALRSD